MALDINGYNSVFRNFVQFVAKLPLDVAPDGNTATVTLVATAGLTEGSSPGDTFGQVQLTRQMTVDLRPDVPVVTDVKLAQTLVA